MSSAYRSAYDHIVGLKREEIREAREQLEPLLPQLRDVNDARVSRIVSGSAGVFAALCMAYFAATSNDTGALYALILGVVALVAGWAAPRAVLSTVSRFVARVRPEPELTGQLDRDLSLIDASDVRRDVRALEARADKLETASIALPIAGITFLTPLFLHWLFVAMFMGDAVRNYANWIRISLVIVGHAHVALAILGWRFARKLHGSTIEVISTLRVHREWAKIWLITIGVASIPGIVLLLVPPLLVAATGIVFIPFMITGMRQIVLQERLKLVQAAPERMRIEGLDIPVELTEEQKREADRDDEDAGADAGDRAQA